MSVYLNLSSVLSWEAIWLPALSLVILLCGSIWHRHRQMQQAHRQCAGRDADQPLYVSPCGKRVKVAVKIYTPAGLNALPVDTATQLQAGCDTGADGNKLQVLGMAAREGCVVLSVDAVHIASSGIATTSAHAANSHARPAIDTTRGTADTTLDSANRFLAALQPVLQQAHGAAENRSQLPVGLRVQVQVDHDVYQAVWDATAAVRGCWNVQAAAGRPHNLLRPYLGLICACSRAPVARHNAAAHSTPAATHIISNGADSVAPTSSLANATSTPNSEHGTHQRAVEDSMLCSLIVQAWDLPPGIAIQSWAPPRSPHASAPAANSAAACTSDAAAQMLQPTPAERCSRAAGSKEQPCYHLLVHCGGVYLPTTVLQAQAWMLPEQLPYIVLPDRVQLMQVDVHLPQSLLLRHHQPDGPPTGLQAFTLELWDQDRLLHAACHAMKLPQQAAGAATSSQSQSSATQARSRVESQTAASTVARLQTAEQVVWWWGAKPCTVQQVVHELHAIEQQLWACGSAITWPELQAYHALCADICTWLEAVRQGAAASGYCMALMQAPAASRKLTYGMATSTLTAIPPIPTALAVHIGECLLQYASGNQLPGLQAMVEQQLHEIFRCQANSATTATPQYTCMWLLWRCIRGSLLGYACQGCEQRYKAQLSKQLAAVQIINAVLMIGISVTGIMRALSKGPPVFVFLIAVFIVLQIGMIMQHMRRRARGLPAQCSPVCIFTWCMRITYSWRAAVKVMPPSMRAWYTGWGWVIIAVVRVLLSLNDQLTASTIISGRLMSAMLALDAWGMFATLLRVRADQRPNWQILATCAMWPCVVVLLLPRCLDILSRYLVTTPTQSLPLLPVPAARHKVKCS